MQTELYEAIQNMQLQVQHYGPNCTLLKADAILVTLNKVCLFMPEVNLYFQIQKHTWSFSTILIALRYQGLVSQFCRTSR